MKISVGKTSKNSPKNSPGKSPGKTTEKLKKSPNNYTPSVTDTLDALPSVAPLVAPTKGRVTRPVKGRRPPTHPLETQVKTYDAPTVDPDKVVGAMAGARPPGVMGGFALPPAGVTGVKLRPAGERENVGVKKEQEKQIKESPKPAEPEVSETKPEKSLQKGKEDTPGKKKGAFFKKFAFGKSKKEEKGKEKGKGKSAKGKEPEKKESEKKRTRKKRARKKDREKRTKYRTR